MTLATAKPKRARPAERRTPADGRQQRLLDHGAWFLVLPALIPILVPSVGPLPPPGSGAIYPAGLRERLEHDGNLVPARYQR